MDCKTDNSAHYVIAYDAFRAHIQRAPVKFDDCPADFRRAFVAAIDTILGEAVQSALYRSASQRADLLLKRKDEYRGLLVRIALDLRGSDHGLSDSVEQELKAIVGDLIQ